MKKIITTVGTSLFSNYMKPEIKYSFEADNKKYLEIKDKTFEELFLTPSLKYEDYTRELDQIKETIKNNWFKGIDREKSKKWVLRKDSLNTHASAEIKSILSLQKKFDKDKLEVHLIATDTILSRLAAELIKNWFEEYNKKNDPEISVYFDPKIDVCKSLQITDGEVFEREGIPNLINLCDRIVAGNYLNSMINITGGYKAILPYMTIYGQINNIPLYYIFEDTNNLIHIPQVPIDINWNLFEKYWEQFVRLDNGEIGKTEDFSFDFLNEAEGCLEISDDIVVLNPLGLILWNKYKSKFFLFMAPDDVFSEIQLQKDIQRILRGKFADHHHRRSKTEKKQDHYVFDDGNNNNRIYYFEESGMIYVYKTFENEELAKKYINEKFDKNKVIKLSKVRKMEVNNV